MQELPLNLDLPRTFLDQVGGFVARTRRRTWFSKSLKNNLASSEEHLGRLQWLRVSQQVAWEEKEFADNLIRKEEAAEETTAVMVDYFT